MLHEYEKFDLRIVTLKPSPSLPRTFSAGILTSSKKTSAVLLHLMPIFFSGGPLVTPPNSLSTTKAVIFSFVSPVFGSLKGTCAKTVMILAIPPFDIQILLPLRTQCDPSADLIARERIELASEPAPGSVKQKAAYSPLLTRGRYFAFCSGVPYKSMP